MTTLANSMLRETCPSCMRAGGECERCNGSGYVFKEPYAHSSGEQAFDVDELESFAQRQRIGVLERALRSITGVSSLDRQALKCSKAGRALLERIDGALVHLHARSG